MLFPVSRLSAACRLCAPGRFVWIVIAAAVLGSSQAAEPIRYLNSTTFADSVVTFNEVLYQPPGDEVRLEWIELHNQHAILEDLSNWTIEGGIQFRFPAGTTLAGGGYLIVAADPALLRERTGLTALGPFTGQLGNNGDHLVLRNLNGRLMDELDYVDSFPWPAGADGSGASLAKIYPGSPSSPAENWRASAQLGGTPGTVNFPESSVQPPATFDVFITNRTAGRWKVPSAADASVNWIARGFDDAAWNSGTVAYGFDTTGSAVPAASRYYPIEGSATDTSGSGFHGILQNGVLPAADPAPVPGSTGSLKFDGANDFVRIEDAGDRPTYSLSAWVKLGTVRPCSIVLRTDDGGPLIAWSHQLRVTADGFFEHYTFDGNQIAVTGRTRIEAGRWYHVAATAGTGGVARLYVNGVEDGTARNIGIPWAGGRRWLLGTDTAGFPNFFQGNLDEFAIWNRELTAAEVASLALGNVPGFPGGSVGPFETDLASAMAGRNTSAWIRHTFNTQSPAGFDQLTFRVRYDDGFVAWLNGVEVARRNFSGAPAWNSAATAARPAADSKVTETIDLSAQAGLLVPAGNVLAVQLLNASPTDRDALLGFDLVGRRRSSVVAAAPTLSFSEVTSATSPGFYCELVNNGPEPVSLAGLLLRSSAGGEHAFGAGTVARGSYLLVDADSLGFPVNDGDRLFLLSAGGIQLVDTVVLSRNNKARQTLDPSGPFLRPSQRSPGAPNRFDLHDEIVINEILYHAPPRYARAGPPAVAFEEDLEQWIELFNRSAAAVDLSGWRLRDDVDFRFPDGTVLDPGAYLVVTGDSAALRQKYPGIRILGDWKGKLGGRTGHLLLQDSDENPAMEVRYFDDNPWPSRADGGGSSLELRNPFIDASVPEAWAASDESSRSQWKSYKYRAKAIRPVKTPDLFQFHEFRMGLLADGEALVDDLTVIEDPDGTNRQLIQNTAFNDTKAWRLLGNHSHSSVIDDPDQAGNKVLRLVATDARGYMHNQLESTLKSGNTIVPVVAGKTYEIAFRAKWIGGSPQLNTELYYNKVIQTVILDQPAQHGTPGRRNSAYVEHPGPTYSGLYHWPPVPKPSEPVTIRVAASSPDGIESLTLYHSTGGAAWQTLPMSREADGRFAATIPAKTANSIVQFYVEGRSAYGARSTIPAAGPASRALYRVDSRTPKAPRKGFHFVMTPADGNLMDAVTNMMSDDRLGATVIWDNREIFYDCGVHLHGSMFTRSDVNSVPYNMKFPSDHKFRGVHRTVQVNRGVLEEILAKHVQNQVGIPGMYEDIVELFSHRPANAGAARMSLAHYNDIYLGSQFEDGTRGMLYNMEGIRVLQSTHNGNPEGIKLGSPAGWVGDYDIMNLGDDPEQYRWSTTLRNNRAVNDYTPYIAMAKAFSLSGIALEQAVPSVIDVDQWMRYYACLTLFEIGDTYTLGNPHNIGFYARASDRKIIALPYDWDFFFANGDTSPLWGNQNLVKIVTRPVYTRLLYQHLLDMVEGAFSTNYIAPFITNYGQAAGGSFTAYLSRIRGRSAYVRSRLPAKVNFEISSNTGLDFAVATPETTLEGRGWVDVRNVRINGRPTEGLTWLDANRWRLTVPLPESTNRIQLDAFNRRGEPVGSDSITITTTGADDSQRRFLRISEIHYHPPPASAEEFNAGYVDGDDFEFIELANVGPADVSLKGVKFTAGIQFDFSTSAVTNLAAGARVVVVRNPAAFAFRYGNVPGVAGTYTDALSNGGELVRLVDRLGLTIQEVQYGDSDPWPSEADGGGASLELVSFDGDLGVPSAWLANTTGGTPGSAPIPIVIPTLTIRPKPEGGVRIEFRAHSGQRYRLLAQSHLDGTPWDELRVEPAAPGDRDVIWDEPASGDSRYYRLVTP